MTLETYVPDRHYRPAFYDWVARNWPQHARYAWPWLHEEWAAPYRTHFEREYRDSTAWIADYILAAMLQKDSEGKSPAPYTQQGGVFFTSAVAQDDAGRNVAADAPQSVVTGDPINPELTNSIEDEVRESQIAEAQEDSNQRQSTQFSPQTGPQPAVQQDASEQSVLTPRPAALKIHFHYFYFVDGPLPIYTEDKVLDCTLTKGAILVLQTPPQPGEKTAEVKVESSNRGDCSPESRFRLLVDTLVGIVPCTIQLCTLLPGRSARA